MKTSSVAKALLSSVTVLALLSCACAAEPDQTKTPESAVEPAEKSENPEKVEKVPEIRLDVPATGADLFIATSTIFCHIIIMVSSAYILFNLYYPLIEDRSLSSSPFDLRRLGRHIFSSLDVVESTFSMLDIDEPVCRKRAICEVQRTASTYPLLGDYLKYLSQSLRGLDRYREAQDAGSVLEDCALLFADCPYSVLPREGIKKE
ncbi:uncharacterized protein LOC135220103 isoform X1 [Macrobrachium nipponense]|uniref:uncharacterized protein LOC135220103 isoform X1 n=1 Tax=Macrobrachium nipponense TaxID=159736 RepID=UPI0030C8086C